MLCEVWGDIQSGGISISEIPQSGKICSLLYVSVWAMEWARSNLPSEWHVLDRWVMTLEFTATCFQLWTAQGDLWCTLVPSCIVWSGLWLPSLFLVSLALKLKVLLKSLPSPKNNACDQRVYPHLQRDPTVTSRFNLSWILLSSSSMCSETNHSLAASPLGSRGFAWSLCAWSPSGLPLKVE